VYKPVFRITPYLLKLIEEAAVLRSWIEATPLKVAWLPLLQHEARVRATHSSTSIEGNPLTLAQVDAVAKEREIGGESKDKLEVKNYLKLMRWIEKHAKRNINERSLPDAHKLLTKGLLPKERSGKYKDKQNYVVDGKGVKIFVPPSPKDTLPLMKELLEWLNSSGAGELPPVVICAIFHHRLVSIHPFVDGNGRLARAAGTWILYQRGFDTYHIFSLDDFFAGDRQRYYEKLQQARELDNRLTYWIEYVAEGIVKTLKETKARIEDLQVSLQYDLTLTPSQEELVRLLRSGKAQGSAELKKRFKVSRARINQIVAPLLKAGLVSKTGEGRSTRYFLRL
jgi:Fic family protein